MIKEENTRLKIAKENGIDGRVLGGAWSSDAVGCVIYALPAGA